MNEESRKDTSISVVGNKDSASEAEQVSLSEMVDAALADIHTEIERGNAITVPIVQLGLLGGTVASMIPALRTATQTTTVNTTGLYRLANESIGDTLKVAKNGNFWGAFKKADGGSKFVQLQNAGPVSATNSYVMPIDPATMMMAAALFVIEQQLGNIEEMGEQIISFLEIEKESKIEADVKTLTSIIANYKHNWDNKLFVASNHKMVLDIQRSSREHMISYQRMVSDSLKAKSLIMGQSKVAAALDGLMKKFKYYKLSLFSYSLASMLEVMLSGNFKEEYLQGICHELEEQGAAYRDLFTKSSVFLEKISGTAIEKSVLKGIGTTSVALGKFMGELPLLKKGSADEFLQNRGLKLSNQAEKLESAAVRSFAEIRDPGIRVFVSRLTDMTQIYNHTSDICFDDKNIYLIG